MLPYILLWGIPTVCYFVCIDRREDRNRKLVLRIGHDERIRARNLMIPVFFAGLLLMLSLRHETVGTDTANYHAILIRDAGKTLREIFLEWDDPLFRLYNFVFYRLTDNFQIYLAVTALIEVIPIAMVYAEDRRHAYLKIILFLNMSTFILLFSGIRQSLALSLGILAFYFLKRGKKVAFLLTAIAASLFHVSGFLVFLFFPLYYIRFRKKHLLFILPATIALLLLNDRVFAFLTGIFSRIYGDIGPMRETGGALGSLLLFALLAGFVYLITDDDRMDEETFALRNMLVFAVWMQCFAPLHNLAMRANYYFILFIPLAVSKCLSCTHPKFAQLAKLGEAVLCIFFTGYFVYTLHVSHISGTGALDTVPYIPFWKGSIV